MYNKTKTKILGITTILLLLLVNSCETTELELLNSPNALSPDSADIDFFMTSIQTDAAYFFEGVTERGMELTRIIHMYGPLYDNAYSPSNLNSIWSRFYSGALPDIRNLVPIAEEQELYTHIAIAQVLEVYMMATLVDYIGDIPYSESNDGVSFNPMADLGADIYAKLITLLDDAVSNFNKSEARKPAVDLFYNGDEAKWIKFANTLKLKL